MTGPSGNRNVALHHAVRELVSAYLQTRGFDTMAKPRDSTVSGSLNRGIAPDVSGLDGIYLDVTSRGIYRLSVDLDAARSGADVTGHAIAAFVQHRAGRLVDESFVVLSLADFASLAKISDSRAMAIP